MRVLPLWLRLAVFGSIAYGPTASAQQGESVAPTASQQPAANDVVRLKNGGVLVGTISEFLPGEKVIIVTAAGNVREVPWVEIEYAGRAADEPRSASSSEGSAGSPPTKGSEEEKAEPYVTISAPKARLHLESNPLGVTFLRESGSSSSVGSAGGKSFVAISAAYDKLCTAPCQVTLPAGTEVFALSREGEFPIAADAVTIPAGDSKVIGSFKSRAGLRTAGWVIAAGSLVVGGLLIWASFGEEEVCSTVSGCRKRGKLHVAPLGAGIVLGAAGPPIGVAIALTRDVAQVDVQPMPNPVEKSRLASAPGLILEGKF